LLLPTQIFKLKSYIDAFLVGTGVSSSPPSNIIRSSNFIGRSNWYFASQSTDPDADADLDEIRLFNRGLTQQEIELDFSLNSNPYFTTQLGLNYHWTFDSSYGDQFGGMILYGGINYDFTNDRNNNSFSAISLTNGFEIYHLEFILTVRTLQF